MAYNKVSPHCTKIIPNDGGAIVQYHSTIIVSAGHMQVVLNTGGYSSVTTKRKMNQASQQFGLGYGVFQKNYNWFVTTKAGTFAFDDRMFRFDRATGIPLDNQHKVA